MTRYYPLEIDLKNRPILMVGGGKVAGRKLPELLACGAKIRLVAPKLSPMVRRLLPGFIWEDREFKHIDIEHMTLVFACTDSKEANQSISETCRLLNIPCNRADDAAQGNFIVPGMVRRGDVILTISTAGKAPAITKHLKQKLAASIGAEWGVLTEIIAEARSLGLHLTQGVSFDVLAELARKQGKKEVLLNLGNHSQVLPHSTSIYPVILVGAGPGPRELLTSAAIEAISEAEVVVHDRLVTASILELIPYTCEIIPAEKRGHFESKRQEHINTLLVEKARMGLRVIRLKGGDPFVFGRGFEEALALEEAGIPWKIIPGLSSAIAVPALAGIPLTHRGVARSFAVVSGMAGENTNVNFPKADTLVLLMALYRLEEIIPALLQAGYLPRTPVAVIQNGGLPEQRICQSHLSELREDVAKQGFDSPSLIVVGDVVALRDKSSPSL